MGLIKKIFKGNKEYYKIYTKCSNSEHERTFIVSTKEKDFEEKMKKKDADTLNKALPSHCDKCVINVDKIEDGNVKKSKKIYTLIEL